MGLLGGGALIFWSSWHFPFLYLLVHALELACLLRPGHLDPFRFEGALLPTNMTLWFDVRGPHGLGVKQTYINCFQMQVMGACESRYRILSISSWPRGRSVVSMVLGMLESSVKPESPGAGCPVWHLHC